MLGAVSLHPSPTAGVDDMVLQFSGGSIQSVRTPQSVPKETCVCQCVCRCVCVYMPIYGPEFIQDSRLSTMLMGWHWVDGYEVLGHKGV